MSDEFELLDNLFWFDVETTGKLPWIHDIIQLSYVVTCEQDTLLERNLLFQPHSYENIDAKVLEDNKTSIEDLRDREMKADDAYKILVQDLTSIGYTGRYGAPKLVCAGYNVAKFDMQFLDRFFKKCTTDKHFWYFFRWSPYIDVLPIVIGRTHMAHVRGLMEHLPEKYHLQPTYEMAFGETANFRDAFADIKATRRLYYDYHPQEKK